MSTRTETITLFTPQSLAKGASLESENIYLGKCGANTRFELDLTLMNPGKIRATQLVANGPNASFFTPSTADVLASSHLGGATTASRERYSLNMVGTDWLRIKLRELNASNVNIRNCALIISRP